MTPRSQSSATAFAPATVANVAVGFDCLGFALEGIGDRVTCTRTTHVGKVEIGTIQGPGGLPMKLPNIAGTNTATAGLVALLERTKAPFGLKVDILKGIPLGSGMGGSAASAVAGIVAANALFPTPLEEHRLLKYALIGEAVASGSKHGDNVYPSLLGGMVLVTSVEPPGYVRIPVPKGLYAVVVHPPLMVETKAARAMLKADVPLKLHSQQSARLAAFVAGCFRSELPLIQQSLVDTLIEPQRASLIQGFKQVQAAALGAGALGCSISGAGPAVFALAHNEQVGAIAAAMVRAFEAAGVRGARAYESIVTAPGAKVVDG